MASPEIQKMFLGKITPSEQPPQETKKLVADGDLLIEIKQIYDSWPYEDISLTTVLNIHRNNSQKSSVIKDSEKLGEVKEAVKKILQEHKLKASTVYDLGYARGYKEETLRRFGDNPDLKNSLLEKIFKQNSGMDNDSQQKREELVAKALADGTAFCKRDDTWHDTSQNTFINFRKNNPTPITIIPRELPKPKLIEPSKIETPIIEEPPTPEDILFESIPFLQKFEAVKNFEREYKSGGQTNRNIPLLEAIDLVQPNSENRNSRGSEQISSLKTWFEIHHLEIHDLNVSQINKKTFSSFLKANSNIIPFFDNQDSDTKLSEVTFRIITNKLADNIYKKLQFFISKILLTIPSENRPNINQLENYIEKCKLGFDSDINDQQQEERIKTIYSSN